MQDLKAETLVQQLNKSTHKYYQIGTKINAKYTSEIQLKLATRLETEYAATLGGKRFI